MSGTLVVENCAVATVDGRGSEYAVGYVVVSDGRIVQVGPGAAPVLQHGGARVVDGSGCLATPGLVNSHHHLYQWIFRGLAQDATLFDWLTELYPRWARIDEPAVHAAARAGLGWLALSGCSTSSDHHYLFPRGSGDLLGATIRAAREVGVRLDATRGSMDLGRSAGGLPPDSVVENLDEILKASKEAVDRHHDPSPGSLTRIALAPCSPFSVTDELMKQSAVLARELGVRLHTHLAETVEEDEYCREQFGVTPAEYVESLGWM